MRTASAGPERGGGRGTVRGTSRSLRLTLLSSLLALVGCPGGDGPPGAQGVETWAALELEATYPEAFSFLNSVRELSDKTLLAADPLSQVLLRVDLVAGTADTLGRVGSGPQEYRQPDQVFPLPGDSTLLVDLGNAQLSVVDPNGVLVDAMKIASATGDGRMEILMPRAVDGQGRIWFAGRRAPQQGPPDSTAVLRYDRATHIIDTLGWTWWPEPRVSGSGSVIRMMSRQMEARDDWAAGPDGQLALVRAAGYAVEWHYPDGRVVRGPSNPVEAHPISDEDKRVFLEQRAAGLAMMISTSRSGSVEVSMRRVSGGVQPGLPGIADFQWAETLAPFRPERSMVSPRGELWVERWLPVDRGTQIDVFDADGVKLGVVDLPDGRQLIGFGSTTDGEPAVYLVRTDEVDLKWLERYRLVRR